MREGIFIIVFFVRYQKESAFPFFRKPQAVCPR